MGSLVRVQYRPPKNPLEKADFLLYIAQISVDVNEVLADPLRVNLSEIIGAILPFGKLFTSTVYGILSKRPAFVYNRTRE